MPRPEPENIATRDDLVAFVERLHHDLVTEGEGWENRTLDRYLEALSAWLRDLPGWFEHRGEPLPTEPDWRLVGRMLAAATVYE